ncbi:SDR family NAD(P)-dependent oxidoreductase [Acinetobacter sp. ANC 3791]|uniref:SDR family NAD(P)-dependent oxidoreductase n=1 Tax=Acinetobacter sp. ANC 3791 TaxID=2529836 RepID=UPI00103EC042|nr:SDR family oxidoreductase [Acinetobacter sp. ANC 3791]TCB83185.1 SDR family oxidoreductase [Acinetobacter sp. ANC 3791]
MSHVLEKFKNKTALITGASSGIGQGFAEYLAKQGIHLIIVARSTEKLQHLAEQLQQRYSIQVDCISLDLAKLDAASQLFEKITQQGLGVDILINNAGFGKWTKFLEQSLQSYQEMTLLNMLTVTQLTQLFLPKMLQEKQGIILNVASTAAFQPLPYIAVYGATKSYVLNFTEALAGEYRNSGVQLLALCPGNTTTNFAEVAQANTEGMQAMTVEEVIQSAMRGLEKKQTFVITGKLNYLTAQLARVLSRQSMVNLVANMFEKRIASA